MSMGLNKLKNNRILVGFVLIISLILIALVVIGVYNFFRT